MYYNTTTHDAITFVSILDKIIALYLSKLNNNVETTR